MIYSGTSLYPRPCYMVLNYFCIIFLVTYLAINYVQNTQDWRMNRNRLKVWIQYIANIRRIPLPRHNTYWDPSMLTFTRIDRLSLQHFSASADSLNLLSREFPKLIQIHAQCSGSFLTPHAANHHPPPMIQDAVLGAGGGGAALSNISRIKARSRVAPRRRTRAHTAELPSVIARSQICFDSMSNETGRGI